MNENIEKLIALYSYGQKTRDAEAVSDEACGTIIMESILDVEGLGTKLFALSIYAANSNEELSQAELNRAWDTIREIGKAITLAANNWASIEVE